MLKSETAGSSLIQVLVLQGVALILLSLLLPIAIQSSKLANTSASRTSLLALILRAKFSMVDTGVCKNRVTVNGAINTVSPTPPSLKNELTILDSTGAIILKGSDFGGLGFVQTADFKVRSVQLQVTHSFSQGADFNFSNAEPRYLANVVVTAQRNNVGGVASFLGSSTIVESFPIIFQLGPAAAPLAFEFCSARSRYLVALGPPPLTVKSKSVLECLDRDGVPAQVPGLGGPYYVCEIPYAPGYNRVMFPNGCNPAILTAPKAAEGSLHHEGWVPDATAPPPNFIYCI